MKPIVVNLVAVRMKSKRLPGKALKTIEGKSILWHLMQRVRMAKVPVDTVICTSTLPGDDPIEVFANEYGFKVFRGHPENVLLRFIEAAEKYLADHIVRITGDNPLTDPFIIDEMVKLHIKERADYTFTEDTPRGTRPEIISFKAMKKCLELSVDPNFSEYMTLYFKDHPHVFRHAKYRCPSDKYYRPNYTVTIDTQDDFEVVEKLYNYLYKKNKEFTLLDIIEFFDNNPHIDHEGRIKEKVLDPSINTKLRIVQ